ncbi:MAG: glycosyltransferase [Methylococcaceae bacterium]|jgi:hypothetical protein
MHKPLILFVILHEISVLNASFRLARDLENSGKEIRYVGLLDSEEIVRSNGYAYSPVFQEQFPLGSATKLGFEDLSQLGFLRYIRVFPERLALFRSFTEYLVAGGDGEFIELLRGINPDIIVFSGSPYIEWAMLMAYPLKKKAVYLHATFSPCENSGLPPASSEIIPVGGSVLEKLRILLAWKRKKIVDKMKFAGFGSCTKRLADKYGLKTNIYRHDTGGYKKNVGITLPELFAFPPEFDFSPVKVPGQYFIGPLVCHERREPDFPWQKLDGSRPLIYCTFGTHVWFSHERYKHLYGIIMDTATCTQEWQWVITTGYAITPDEFDAIPENVVLVKMAPQANLLKKANIMISHGGTSTISECIINGVPIIVLPMGDDQYGNAARIAYHGIGVRGDIKKLSIPYLLNLIKIVDVSSYFRSQVKLMQEKFLEMEVKKPGVKLINSLLN